MGHLFCKNYKIIVDNLFQFFFINIDLIFYNNPGQINHTVTHPVSIHDASTNNNPFSHPR